MGYDHHQNAILEECLPEGMSLFFTFLKETVKGRWRGVRKNKNYFQPNATDVWIQVWFLSTINCFSFFFDKFYYSNEFTAKPLIYLWFPGILEFTNFSSGRLWTVFGVCAVWGGLQCSSRCPLSLVFVHVSTYSAQWYEDLLITVSVKLTLEFKFSCEGFGKKVLRWSLI